uniref:Uncharacterized protein n=1 Tax=Physcomitrium patens TaxID=3218 RepID=A0A2K1LB39_PHYPA|nr:hypothetical protein PHYPA_001673 [Physcomitrium patens]
MTVISPLASRVYRLCLAISPAHSEPTDPLISHPRNRSAKFKSRRGSSPTLRRPVQRRVGNEKNERFTTFRTIEEENS